jgi:hypothetical protein
MRNATTTDLFKRVMTEIIAQTAARGTNIAPEGLAHLAADYALAAVNETQLRAKLSRRARREK